MWGRALCFAGTISCATLDLGALQSGQDGGTVDTSMLGDGNVATDTSAPSDAGLDGDFSCNAKDLLGFWHADEGMGKTFADCTSNHFDAQLSGSPPWTLVGRNGIRPALNFQGTNDYAILDYTALDISGPFSVSLWTIVTDSDGTLMGRASSSSQSVAWLLEYESTGTNFRVGSIQISGAPLVKSVWTHIAVVYAPGASMELYIGGKKVASQTSNVPGSVPNSGNRVHMGYIPTPGLDASNPYHHLDGSLQDVRFYSAAISAESIAVLALE